MDEGGGFWIIIAILIVAGFSAHSYDEDKKFHDRVTALESQADSANNRLYEIEQKLNIAD